MQYALKSNIFSLKKMLESGVIHNIWSKYRVKKAEARDAISFITNSLFYWFVTPGMSWQWTGCFGHGQPPGNLPDPGRGFCSCNISFDHWMFYKVMHLLLFFQLLTLHHYRYNLRRTVRKSSLDEKTVVPGLKDLLSWLLQ